MVKLDEPIRYITNEAIQSAVETFTTADPERVWTVREVAEWVGIGGFGPLLVGSAATVADQMEAWIAETGIDGFNFACVVTPETFCGRERPAGPRTAAPRPLQDRVSSRHAARQAVRRRAALGRAASGAVGRFEKVGAR